MGKIVQLRMGPRLEGYCDDIGRKRMEQAIIKGRSPHNNASTDIDERALMDRIGARCEGISWSWLKPIRWNTLTDNVRDLPDLETNSLKIDVKGRRLNWHDLIVQLDDPPDWAYLMVSAEDHPVYRIQGWLWGHEVRTFPVLELIKGRPAYVVKDKKVLRDPQELMDEKSCST